MLQQLFNDYQKNLDFFFERIDLAQVEKLVDLFLRCSGMLIFTGVGKSGVIAEKLALTLISTGTKALFLPPLNALHGDIGIVSRGDIVVLLSKSGESEELLQLIPYIRQKGAGTVAWVVNAESKLMKACDIAVALPFQKELCPFDLAPTTSTAIQLIFGDVLSVALMKAKGFCLDDYALNHPAGSLGKKISLTVSDVMLQGDKLPLCQPQESLTDVLVELTAKQCGCLIVVDQDQCLKGIFTDGDLRRALHNNCTNVFEKKVGDLMTRNCIETSRDQRASDALQLMQRDSKRWVTVIPVVEHRRVVGLIRMHDIIQAGI